MLNIFTKKNKKNKNKNFFPANHPQKTIIYSYKIYIYIYIISGRE